MRRLRNGLELLAFAVCALLVLGALLVVVIGRSGMVRDHVLATVREQLGPDADGFELESARLHWSDPGLRLEGLRLLDASGDEMLWVESLRARIGLFPPRLDTVEIDGGRVTISQAGFELIERWRERNADAQSADRPAEGFDPRRIPTIELSHLELWIDSERLLPIEPPWRSTLLDLTLRCAPRERGLPWIVGEAIPRPTPDSRLAPVRFSGAFDPDGRVRVQASSTDLDLDVRALPPFLAERVDLAGPWRAEADLEFTAEFVGLDPIPRDAELGLRVDDFEPLGPPAPLAPRDVRLIARGHFERPVAADGTLGVPELSASAELDGIWREAPFEASVHAGGAAPAGRSVVASARAVGLPLDDRTYAAIVDSLRDGAELETSARITENVIASLGIEGACELRADYAMDAGGGADAAPRQRVGVVALPLDDTSLTYRGWPSPTREPIGFPVPVQLERGRVVIQYDGAAPRRVQVGFVDMGGAHGSGEADVFGYVATTPDGALGLGRPPELRLTVDVPSMDVDSGVRLGLSGLNLSYDVLEQVDPSGGTVGARLELAQTSEERIPRMSLSFDLRRIGMTWALFPLALGEIDGELDLRFAGDYVEGPLRPDGRPSLRRPFGLRVAANGVDADDTAVSVQVGVREPDTSLLGGVERHPPGTFPILRGVAIEASAAPMGGAAYDVARGVASVDAVLEKLRAEGAVDVAVRSSVWARDEPRTLTIEIEPEDLRAGATRSGEPVGPWLEDLRGQARIERFEMPGLLLESDGAPDGELPAPDVLVRVELSGSLPGLKGVAARFDARPGPPRIGSAGSVELVLSGADPAHPVWRELAAELATEEAVRALEQVETFEVGGRLDVDVTQKLASDLAPLGLPEILVDLRRNGLRVGTLGIDELLGSIATDGATFNIPRLAGSVAGEPLVLEDVRLVPGVRLGALERDARRLLDRAVGEVELERIVTARLDLDSARIDADLVARATGGLRDGDWQVLIDAEDALAVVALPEDLPPVIGISGAFRPHDLRFTNALRLSSAEVRLRHLIVDGADVRGAGRVDQAFGDAGGLSIDNASATLSYTGGRLTLDGLEAGLAGGRLTSDLSAGGRALSLDLVEPYRFDAAFAFDGIDVNRILEQVLKSDGTDAGTLRGNLSLVGRPYDPLSLEGRGFFALENARLYSIPVVRQLVTLLGFDATATFDWMRTEVRVADGRLELTDAVAHSPLIKLVGGGTIGLDGQLDHDFDLAYSVVDKLGFFSKLFYWFQSRFLRIAVRGDMTRPRVLLTNPILDLFGRSRQQPPSLPYPRRRGVPERF